MAHGQVHVILSMCDRIDVVPPEVVRATEREQEL